MEVDAGGTQSTQRVFVCDRMNARAQKQPALRLLTAPPDHYFMSIMHTLFKTFGQMRGSQNTSNGLKKEL